MLQLLVSCPSWGRDQRSLLNTFPFNAADVQLPVARQGSAPDNLVDFASVAEASAAGKRCIDKVCWTAEIISLLV
jgi:hypothetical protein